MIVLFSLQLVRFRFIMDIENVNKTLLVKSLNFHGVQLQKIFETEHSSFSNLQLDSQLHFNEYTKRQKQQR